MKGKRSNRTATPQEWDNPLPRWMRAVFWRRERRAQKTFIAAEAHDGRLEPPGHLISVTPNVRGHR